MHPNSLFGRLVGTLALATLLLAPACKKTAENKESPEVKELTQKAAQLDEFTRKVSEAAAAESQKLAQAKVNIKPDQATLQLTEPQKKALEKRINGEKNSSYQALLQEVLDKDKEIEEFSAKINALKKSLPVPDVAKEHESHFGLAMRFLRKQGVPDDQAKLLVNRVLILDKLMAGMEVYHFYSHGVYGTWVAQGSAKMTPSELQAEERAKIEGERDTAVAQGKQLLEELADLNAQRAQAAEELAAMAQEKAKMVKDMEAMAATSEAQKAELNSMHYLVGARKDLEGKGIIVIPVFAKDRAGAKWNDNAFTKSMDLRSQDSITITAAEVGLSRIGKVSVVPGSLEKDQHYSLTLSEGKAVVKILNKDRFRNEKVVFAVSE